MSFSIVSGSLGQGKTGAARRSRVFGAAKKRSAEASSAVSISSSGAGRRVAAIMLRWPPCEME